MTFPKVRLAVSFALLVGWLGFLLYLVIDSHRVILSKPQFLLAQVVVVIDVRDNKGQPDPDVAVDEVLFPPQQHLAKLRLPDLAECGKAQGYRGAGKYLVPLVKTWSGGYVIAPIPRVPTYPRQLPTHGILEAYGFFSRRVERLPLMEARQRKKELEAQGYKVYLTEEELRVYPWTSDTQAQVAPLIDAKK